MSGIVVTFVGGNDATKPSDQVEPLLQIELSNVPRVGEAVDLPVKQHSAETMIYRVQDVMHIIHPGECRAIVAVECRSTAPRQE